MNRHTLFFSLAVAAQALLLAAVPAQKIYTRATGRSVLLTIRSVDPYSLLSGYYVTLNYEIANPGAFTEKSERLAHGEPVYAILERRTDGAWQPSALSATLPAKLPENRIALRGRYSSWRIEYGIEEFFIPEAKRAEIEQGLRATPAQARAEVRVDAKGNAALVRLIIADRVYDY